MIDQLVTGARYQLANGDQIIADQAFIDEHHPGATLVVETPIVPDLGQRITRLAFRNRFTAAEKVALEIAALDDPTAAMAARQQAASIRVYLQDVASSSFIDLARPETVAGVQALEAGGLLATGRANEILNTAVTAIEVYK